MQGKQRIRNTQLSLMVLAAIGVMAQSPVVLAEDAAPTKLDKIEVTGSNIRRTDAETPSPVQVISAEDLKKSGYTTVSEVLRNISANNQGTLSQSFSGAFASGGSGIALRGLTVGATLVLIDGHRMTPYPISDDAERSFVDISAIPFDSIESVEILKDGASSIYGSDAIAGVVNIKLKKSFTGTRINVDAGVSKYGDGGDQKISITHGFGDLSKDGHTGFFSAEYRHQQPIFNANRGGQYTQRDYTSYGGINTTFGVANTNNNGLQALNGGGVINNGVQTPISPNCTAQNAYGYACPIGTPQYQLQPDTHNVNLLTKFTQSLSNDWEATFGASMFSSQAEQYGQFGTAGYGATGYPSGVFTIAGGPNLPPSIQPASGAVQVVGSDGYLNSILPVGAPGHTVTDTQTYRLTADVAGDAFGWHLDAAGGFSKAILHNRQTGLISLPGLSSIIAANPGVTASQLYSALTNPGVQSTLTPMQTVTDTSELDYISLHGDREIFTFPWTGGGTSALGVGVEYTHKALSTLNPPNVSTGLVAGNVSFAVGEQDTAAAYFESDNQLLKNLELDVSARTDSVNTFGTSTTPKVGLKFTPVQQLALRGTYSRGFRAPNPAESGNSGSVFIANASDDPVLCAAGLDKPGSYNSQCGIQIPSLAQSNPKLKPEKSSSFTLGAIFEPIAGYSVSADYYKIKITDQIVSGSAAQPFSYYLNNGFAVRLPAVPLLQNLAGGGTALTTPTVGPIAYATVPYVNANSTMTSGIDLDFAAKLSLGEQGKLSTDLNITHVFHYELTAGGSVYELAGTHGPLSISGDTGTPQTRATWNITWDKGPFEAAVNVNYVSGFGVEDPSQGANTCGDGLGSTNGAFTFGRGFSPTQQNICSVGSFTTFDLYATYQIDKQWRVRGSVINALDRGAPLDIPTYGAVNYNPSLHQAGAVGRFFSVGATYDF